jgi:hypothetical protein
MSSGVIAGGALSGGALADLTWIILGGTGWSAKADSTQPLTPTSVARKTNAWTAKGLMTFLLHVVGWYSP